VKEFPVLRDMRADYKGNKNKEKLKIWDWSRESIFFSLLKQRSICVMKM
jgi:hypothetical protein